MLFRCVWYFNFPCFNMAIVKNLMKKYPFMMYFQKAYAVLVLHNFFVRETLFWPFVENSVSVFLFGFFMPEYSVTRTVY